MPLTTGRVASSARIAEAIVLSHIQLSYGPMSFPAMQLHSLPRSQPRIAGWSFISRTKWRTKRVCHVITSASSSTFFASKAGGTKSRPLIQPVMRPTTSFTSCFCETSHMKRKRRIISSSTPAGFWSGPSFCARPLSVPPPPSIRVSGWKSGQSGNTRMMFTPLRESSAMSFSTALGSHRRHMYMPAFDAQ